MLRLPSCLQLRSCSLEVRPAKAGSILIVTLWTLIILSILAVALGNFICGQVKFANLVIRSAVSLPLAKAACYDAFYGRNQNKKLYDTEKEMSQERTQRFPGNIGYKYCFEDEGSRININMVTSDVLQRLPGLDKDLADAIVNSNRRPFKVKEEMLLVEGITKDKFKQFKDLITVYGDGRININMASGSVLSALGLEDDLIEIIMHYRKEFEGEDGEEDTDDDGAFLNSGAILQDLRKFTDLSLKQEQDLLSIMNLLTVKSEYLRLNIIPQIKGREGTHYSIVIYPPANKILLWSER